MSAAAITAMAMTPVVVACGSDDEPDVENPPDPEVPVDVDVDDGVDTEVERSGNLGFDEEQPDFED